MARRKDHTRKELIELAINCGRKLVEDAGPQALTARNVAQQMGYTSGTLYNLFKNIEGLTVAINTTSLEDMAQQIDSVFKAESHSEYRIHRFCRIYLDFCQDEPHLWQLLFNSPFHKKALDKSYRTATRKILYLIADALLPFSRSRKAAYQDAKIIWSTLQGLCLRQQDENAIASEKDPIETLVDRFLTQFLDC